MKKTKKQPAAKQSKPEPRKRVVMLRKPIPLANRQALARVIFEMIANGKQPREN